MRIVGFSLSVVEAFFLRAFSPPLSLGPLHACHNPDGVAGISAGHTPPHP